MRAPGVLCAVCAQAHLYSHRARRGWAAPFAAAGQLANNRVRLEGKIIVFHFGSSCVRKSHRAKIRSTNFPVVTGTGGWRGLPRSRATR